MGADIREQGGTYGLLEPSPPLPNMVMRLPAQRSETGRCEPIRILQKTREQYAARLR